MQLAALLGVSERLASHRQTSPPFVSSHLVPYHANLRARASSTTNRPQMASIHREQGRTNEA